MAHLYKRGKKFWVCYYVNGQKVQRSLHTDNRRIAKDKKRKIEYELSVGELHVDSKLPVEGILEDFCKHLMITRTRKSYKNNFSRLRIFFGPVCKSLKVDKLGKNKKYHDKYADVHIKARLLEDITPMMINRFLSDRMRYDNWAPKTANHLRQVLHRLFAYCIKHHNFRSRDRRYPNPVDAVERYQEPAPQIRFLTLKDIEKQLEILDSNPVIHTLVAVYIYAGLRREEALWLTHKDVDLASRLIRVRAKTIDGEFWQPKTKRNRVVPVSNALFDILSEYKTSQRCIWFFPSPKGKRWDPDNFSQDLRKINKAHGLSWSCLDFRHTFGSQLAQKGESLYKISKLMGNSPEICRKHYAALIPEEMTDVVEFSREASIAKSDDGTKIILKEILNELKEGKQTGKGFGLKLVRFNDSA